MFAWVLTGLAKIATVLGDAVTADPLCMRLIALGDWGTPAVSSTAKAISTLLANSESPSKCNSVPETILLLGDNFYENGIQNVTDPKYQEFFVNNFLTPPFSHLSFSVVGGNHGKSGPSRLCADN